MAILTRVAHDNISFSVEGNIKHETVYADFIELDTLIRRDPNFHECDDPKFLYASIRIPIVLFYLHNNNPKI